MGATRHEKSFVDYDKPYEQNLIGFKGIIYFWVGLFLLIVVTFGLMWALINVLEDSVEESMGPTHPLSLSDRERLPPEPRLQAAPGFGVDSNTGRVNLELQAPQSEYWELKKQWDETWANGKRDDKTGTVVSLPIEQAKRVVLQQQNVNTAAAPEGQRQFQESQRYIIESSSGRLATARSK